MSGLIPSFSLRHGSSHLFNLHHPHSNSHPNPHQSITDSISDLRDNLIPDLVKKINFLEERINSFIQIPHHTLLNQKIDLLEGKINSIALSQPQYILLHQKMGRMEDDLSTNILKIERKIAQSEERRATDISGASDINLLHQRIGLLGDKMKENLSLVNSTEDNLNITRQNLSDLDTLLKVKFSEMEFLTSKILMIEDDIKQIKMIGDPLTVKVVEGEEKMKTIQSKIEISDVKFDEKIGNVNEKINIVNEKIDFSDNRLDVVYEKVNILHSKMDLSDNKFDKSIEEKKILSNHISICIDNIQDIKSQIEELSKSNLFSGGKPITTTIKSSLIGSNSLLIVPTGHRAFILGGSIVGGIYSSTGYQEVRLYKTLEEVKNSFVKCSQSFPILPSTKAVLSNQALKCLNSGDEFSIWTGSEGNTIIFSFLLYPEDVNTIKTFSLRSDECIDFGNRVSSESKDLFDQSLIKNDRILYTCPTGKKAFSWNNGEIGGINIMSISINPTDPCILSTYLQMNKGDMIRLSGSLIGGSKNTNDLGPNIVLTSGQTIICRGMINCVVYLTIIEVDSE